MVDRLSKDVLERKLPNTRKNRRRHRKHLKELIRAKSELKQEKTSWWQIFR
jgi:hypothetical protein